MNGYADTRWWTGVNDPAHPLGRSAHASVAHGRYIYIINGYTSTESGMCLFERAGLARYDPLTGSVCFLPVHWDYASVKRYGFSLPLLNTSGMTVALQPETTHQPCYIYIFAGFSLLESFHTNALVRIRLPRSSQTYTNLDQSDKFNHHKICCHAEVIGGHGLLSYVLSLSSRTLVTEAMALTALRAIQRRWSQGNASWRPRQPKTHHCEPSPRDKLCMEYWDGRLYAFGGYGPRFTPHSQWPAQWLCWPFLHNPSDPHEWFPCELDRGWNRQLLIFDLSEQSWSLVERTRMRGAQAPSARAAHQSVLYESHGWLFIFGGRGPPIPNGASSSSFYRYAHRDHEPHESGRLNDLYCLNLRLLEWTRVLTPLDLPNPDSYLSFESMWPTGRSWMGMGLAHLSTTDTYDTLDPLGCLSQTNTFNWHSVRPLFRLCIIGGFSNTNDALSDAWLIQVSKCSAHGLEARVMAASGTGDISTIQPTPVYQTQQPSTMLIDGFRCTASEGQTEPTSILVVERTGLYNHYHYTISDREISYFTDSMVEEDIAFHAQIYNQATFTPKQSTRQSLAQQLKPTRPFYQIARFHTDLILFLLTHFSLYQPCESSDNDRLSETDCIQRRAELEQTCLQLVSTLRPSIQIISFLIRILVKFMLPWEPLCMLLRETDAWLPRSVQVRLVDQLSSGYAAHNSTTVHLALSNQALLDKFALLLPLDKVRIPAPYHAHSLNANDQLSYHIQHTILSFVLWSGASPLSRTVQEWSEPLPVMERADSYLRDPLARFWHSVTFVPLENLFYVIGGATAVALQHPVECYGLLEPSTLFDLCLKRLAVLILRASANQLRPTLRCVDPSDSLRHICILRKPDCDCDLCGYLNGTLTDSVKHKLIQWLL